MANDRAHLEAWLVKRKIGAAVRERILRLNPNPKPGEKLRGWNPAFTQHRMGYRGHGKGWFIREHGREAWEILRSRGLYHKQGRHVTIAEEIIIDREWTRPATRIAIGSGLNRQYVAV